MDEDERRSGRMGKGRVMFSSRNKQLTLFTALPFDTITGFRLYDADAAVFLLSFPPRVSLLLLFLSPKIALMHKQKLSISTSTSKHLCVRMKRKER
jgi:hypothetical protein